MPDVYTYLSLTLYNCQEQEHIRFLGKLLKNWQAKSCTDKYIPLTLCFIKNLFVKN